uniref:Pancreatic secretory granule membrane major glycoprotein GP2 n=1 Tax=Magallana gigas TaxID=29159 RepID=K1QTE6_MAGGI
MDEIIERCNICNKIPSLVLHSDYKAFLTYSKADPCENYSPLPFPYDRYVTNNISGSEVSVLHDRHLERAWYRVGHALDMATTAPSLLHCGTTFPVWMNGSIPDISDGEASRRACILGNINGNFCVHHLEIRVKNCGSYRVYYLPPTPSNDEAYCFEIDIDNTTSSESNTTSVPTTNSPTTTISRPGSGNVTSVPTSDPCFNYSPLPNAYDRYYYNVINGSSGSALHDRHLPEGWYRAGVSLDMPNIAPSHLYCGTYFPVWMDGNIPNISEGIVERKVCFLGYQAGNFCVHHLQIQVKNCGEYRVYYLYPTPSNDEAYCFELDDDETTDSPSTTRVSTTISRPGSGNVTSVPTSDPCYKYSPLPNAYDRYYYNVINGSSGSVLHDRHLPEGWYRAGVSLDMPNIAPSHLYCGTYFPIWMNGNIPNQLEGIVERKVCFLGNQAGNFCVHHLQIQVKNCGEYRVYYLYPTPSNDEAYCFGLIPNVTTGIVNRTVCFLGGDDNWCYHSILIKVKNCGSYRVYLLKPTLTNTSAYCFGSNPNYDISTTTTLPPSPVTTDEDESTENTDSMEPTSQTPINTTLDQNSSTSSPWTFNQSLSTTSFIPYTSTVQPSASTSANVTVRPSASTTASQQSTSLTHPANETQRPTTTSTTKLPTSSSNPETTEKPELPVSSTTANGTHQPATTFSQQQPSSSTTTTYTHLPTTLATNGTKQSTTTLATQLPTSSTTASNTQNTSTTSDMNKPTTVTINTFNEWHATANNTNITKFHTTAFHNNSCTPASSIFYYSQWNATTYNNCSNRWIYNINQ